MSKVIWITGLSGAGKTTIGKFLQRWFSSLSGKVVLLDGDTMRDGLNRDLGFSAEDRDENIRRVSEIAAMLQKQDILPIVTFISPYREARDKARSMVDDEKFVEVYLSTPIEECERRDVKGLYKKARDGEITGFTGIDDPYEEPLNPEITIDTTDKGAMECAREIYLHYMQAQR